MTSQPTFRDQIAGLEAVARANGERDFADLLRAFRFAYSNECRDADECREAAMDFIDEAQRIQTRFEQAADYLDDLQAEERCNARMEDAE